ncbi:MBL fold metallo-hydrolase [Mesorhizobium sp. B2-3-3]|nr:MBL fold metallo-hydrolase [Mesorhizobium sp. B2-3-3]
MFAKTLGWTLLFAAIMAGILPSSAPTFAAAPLIRTQSPGFYRMMLGDFEVTALLDGTHRFPVFETLMARSKSSSQNQNGSREPLADSKPGEIEARLAAADLSVPLEGSINAFLINTGTKLVLIDSGAGALYGVCCGHLLENLRASGYQPEQIDEVLLTHLHADHVGGVMANETMAFPNATIRVSQTDADYWLSEVNEKAAPRFLLPMFVGAQHVLRPYIAAKKFQPFQYGADLLPSIRAIATPGHTPGHSSYIVESRGQKLLVWGDIVHVAPIQFPDPGVTVSYDNDGKQAEQQRELLFSEAARMGYWIGAAHIAFPGLGHVGIRDTHFFWIPTEYTTELVGAP